MKFSQPMLANSSLLLRRATRDDAKMVFDWRNLPEIVALGTSRRPVDWNQHVDWFSQVVTGRDHLLLIVLLDRVPIGQVRFDGMPGNSCSVSIYLLDRCTGRGLGTAALTRACWQAFADLSVERIVATIRKDNPRSIAAFRKAGFVAPGHTLPEPPSEHMVLELRNPPAVPHNRLTFGSPEAIAIARTVKSGQWTAGRAVEQLEASLTRIAGVKHAVCVGSGLAALRLAMLGLGVKGGSRVLVPAYSCVALANAALACGAHPISADVVPLEWNISVDAARKMLIGVQPSVIVAVNTFGVPAPVAELADCGVAVIEDCAHAFGFESQGRPLGGRSHAAVLSFHATKLVGGGEGGSCAEQLG